MQVKRLLVLVSILIAHNLVSYGQSVPNPTATNCVMTLLKKGEAVETSQPTTALTNYQKAHAFSEKINFTKGYFESMRLLAYQLNKLRPLR